MKNLNLKQIKTWTKFPVENKTCPELGDKLQMGFKSIMRVDRGIDIVRVVVYLYKLHIHLKRKKNNCEIGEFYLKTFRKKQFFT